jgi:hypothetical protein
VFVPAINMKMADRSIRWKNRNASGLPVCVNGTPWNTPLAVYKRIMETPNTTTEGRRYIGLNRINTRKV